MYHTVSFALQLMVTRSLSLDLTTSRELMEELYQ